MNLHLHFIQINSDFSQGLADDLYEGEESEDNIKHLWEDELKVSEAVETFKIKNNSTYTLAGHLANDEAFNFEIPDMSVIDCKTVRGKEMQFAVSKKLVRKIDKVVEEDKNETHIYIYIKDNMAMKNPINGVYIVNENFPKALLTPKKMDKINFIRTEFPQLLRTLKAGDNGTWGMMNAQQMVEHMSYSVHYSTADLGTTLVTPERNLEKFRAYALGENDLLVNSKNRMLPELPVPVKNKDLEAAIQEYEKEVNAFIHYFEMNKGAKLMNPIFGEFSYDEWVHLLYKHAQHHAKQFALI